MPCFGFFHSHRRSNLGLLGMVTTAWDAQIIEYEMHLHHLLVIVTCVRLFWFLKQCELVPLKFYKDDVFYLLLKRV